MIPSTFTSALVQAHQSDLREQALRAEQVRLARRAGKRSGTKPPAHKHRLPWLRPVAPRPA